MSGKHYQRTGWPMTQTLFLRFFLELHWEDFQCDIRHLLSSQISRCLHLKQTEPSSAYHHHWAIPLSTSICNSDSISFVQLQWVCPLAISIAISVSSPMPTILSGPLFASVSPISKSTTSCSIPFYLLNPRKFLLLLGHLHRILFHWRRCDPQLVPSSRTVRLGSQQNVQGTR